MSDINKYITYVKEKNEDVDAPSSETQFYIKMFTAYENLPRFVSWNWAAYIFSFIWFFYRKMYVYAFGFMLLSLINILNHDEAEQLVLTLILGLFGNSMYRYHIRKRIENLSNTKGTSILMALLAAIVFAGIVALFYIATNVLQNAAPNGLNGI